MSTECVNVWQFSQQWPGAWGEIIAEKEQEWRNEEALRRLQALMQQKAASDPPNIARTFVLRFSVGERTDQWGSFPSREKAAELAEGLVGHKLVDSVSIYEHVGHYSVFTKEPK